MKCPELMFDKRLKPTGYCSGCSFKCIATGCECLCHTYGIRVCDKEIYGMTGLQELNNYQKHLRTRHHQRVHLMDALERRAESGQ